MCHDFKASDCDISWTLVYDICTAFKYGQKCRNIY